MMMLTGFLANRAGVMGKESEGWLSKLVVNVTCPALILNSVTSCDRLESNAALAVIFLTAAGYFLLLPLLAMLLYLCNVQLPPLIRESVSSVGSVTTPLAMLIIGSSLANQPIGELVKERGVLPFAALRLIALPLVSLLIGRLLIRDNMLLCVLVLASAMPVASNKEHSSLPDGRELCFCGRNPDGMCQCGCLLNFKGLCRTPVRAFLAIHQTDTHIILSRLEALHRSGSNGLFMDFHILGKLLEVFLFCNLDLVAHADGALCPEDGSDLLLVHLHLLRDGLHRNSDLLRCGEVLFRLFGGDGDGRLARKAHHDCDGAGIGDSDLHVIGPVAQRRAVGFGAHLELLVFCCWRFW